MNETNNAVESTCGIYRIFLIGTDRSYVGQAKNIDHRWYDHKRTLLKGTHHAKKLQRAWNKYGEENFKFEVLEVCPCDAYLLLNREQHWMDTLQAYKRGFNCSKSAGLSTLGVTHSSETKAKISAKAKGRITSDETKEKLRQRMKNRVFSKEHLQHLSEAGKKRMSGSPDKLKLAQWSKEHPRYGDSHPLFGKHHSASSKLKMSESTKKYHKDHPATPELKALRSKNAKGLFNPMFGRTHSEETKEKIRQARLKRVSRM
jgi:group I intron endonuclease